MRSQFPEADAVLAVLRRRLPFLLAGALLGGSLAAPAARGQTPAVVPTDRPGPRPERNFDEMPIAVLGGLDKVTARTSSFTVPVGTTGRFGQLLVTVRACRRSPPIDPPESAAFLEIVEARTDEERVARFTGWMFASSPGLSALEDPVYDVWVIDCRKAPTSSSSGGQSGK